MGGQTGVCLCGDVCGCTSACLCALACLRVCLGVCSARVFAWRAFLRVCAYAFVICASVRVQHLCVCVGVCAFLCVCVYAFVRPSNMTL